MFEAMSDFVLKRSEVPQSALDAAALLLIDTLGVAAGAASLKAGQLSRDHAARFFNAGDSEEQCTMLFDGRKASLPGVAFAAATQIDNLDAHDGYNPTKGHIGCAVVPALCAFAQHNPRLSNRDALTAMVIAYEFAARAAVSLHSTVADYHTSGAWNGLGVAALGSRLRGLNAEQLRQALGIAEYHGPRSQMMREIANPSMLHDGSGMGALTGSMAVLLAESGFQGAPAITVEAGEVASFWSSLGDEWTIEKNYIKPYPICRWAHAAIDALRFLKMKHSVQPQDISVIVVNTFEQAAALFEGMPVSTSQAQYSLAFALATFVVHGTIGPKHVQDGAFKDAEVAAVLKKIKVHESEHHSARFPESRWSDVTIELTDGTILESGDIHARGGPESPMKLDEVEQKFFEFAADLEHDRRLKLWNSHKTLKSDELLFADFLKLVYDPMENFHV